MGATNGYRLPSKGFMVASPGMVHAIPFGDFAQGYKDDFQVQPKSMIVYIPDVKGKFFIPTKRITAVYLRPSR